MSAAAKVRLKVNRDATAERLAETGIEPSVGDVGDSYALAETIIGLYKPRRSANAVVVE